MDFGDEVEKKRKRMQLKANIVQGRMGEGTFKTTKKLSGAIVERTGHGSDYKVSEYNWATRKYGKPKEYEVKSSRTAKVSKLQKAGIKKGKVRKWTWGQDS